MRVDPRNNSFRPPEGFGGFEGGRQSQTPNDVSRGSNIDWKLFLACLVGARGFDRIVPGISGRHYMIIAFALLFLLVLNQFKQSLRSLNSQPLLVIMIIWMVASSLVAARPADSLAATVTSILLILYALGRLRSISDTLQTLTLACAVSMAPSIVGLVIPINGSLGFWGAGSAKGYAGYFPWNSSAGYCAGAALICIVILFFDGGRRSWHLVTAAASLLLLYLSEAAAPLASLIAAGVALAGLAIYRRFGISFVVLATVGLGVPLGLFVGIGNFFSLAKIAEFFGRDSDLSGRTDIWQYGAGLLGDSPIFGYGSGVTWDRDWTWSSANNGYLESALRWGLPATFILVVIILLAGYRLAVALNPMLALWTFGVVSNLAVSQMISLTISSLVLWLAVASANQSEERPPGGVSNA